MADKILRQGYYWPSLREDVREFVVRCDECQRFANIPRKPAVEQRPSLVSCPFDRWGLDIVGPFPKGTAQKKFLLVAIEYFSKWVEAETLASITEARVMDFIWRNIVCHFGVPWVFVMDNSWQFSGKRMKEWCEEMGIERRFTSVGYPQANNGSY